jgi:hypothetical protein
MPPILRLKQHTKNQNVEGLQNELDVAAARMAAARIEAEERLVVAELNTPVLPLKVACYLSQRDWPALRRSGVVHDADPHVFKAKLRVFYQHFDPTKVGGLEDLHMRRFTPVWLPVVNKELNQVHGKDLSVLRPTSFREQVALFYAKWEPGKLMGSTIENLVVYYSDNRGALSDRLHEKFGAGLDSVPQFVVKGFGDMFHRERTKLVEQRCANGQACL